MTFTTDMAAAFPDRNPMPPVLRQAVQFLEDLGCVRTYRDAGRYMTLHSRAEDAERAMPLFHLPDPAATASWTHTSDPTVNERLVIFLRTGGDGSWAGLWRDDEGQQRIVHLGSGSGSVMLSVLTDNIDDLLRLLAIGYFELCWPEHFDQTPDEVAQEWDEDGDYPPPPLQFRHYVEQELGLAVPPRGSALVASTASMDDEESDDPFWKWIRALDPSWAVAANESIADEKGS